MNRGGDRAATAAARHPTGFPATALIDTHVKLLDIADAGDELLDAFEDLISLGRKGDRPQVVLGPTGARHLAWRGCLPGGIVTAWLWIGHALRACEISAFIGDPRLQVYVPAHGDVAIFGPLRHAATLAWRQWDEKVRTADDVEALIAGFVHSALSETTPIEPPVRETMPARRPAMVEQPVPGTVDWELVHASDATLTVFCDPEGNVREETVVCHVTCWRTELAAPGTVVAEEPWHDSFQWAAGQWELVNDDAANETRNGSWVLRGTEALTVTKTLEKLPAPLQPWVLESTTRAIGNLDALANQHPAFQTALHRLRDELARVTDRA